MLFNSNYTKIHNNNYNKISLLTNQVKLSSLNNSIHEIRAENTQALSK
jgi:hypothetical protein